MSSSSKIKKILLLLQLTEIEEKEFKQIDRKFSKEFDGDFCDEHDFLRRGKRKDKKIDKAQSSHEIEVLAPPKIKKNDLKSIHRKLARVTHPDLNGDCSEDAFKKIQKAYDEGDGATLLKEAVSRKIEFNLEDDAYNTIKENLDTRRRNLEIKKLQSF